MTDQIASLHILILIKYSSVSQNQRHRHRSRKRPCISEALLNKRGNLPQLIRIQSRRASHSAQQQ